LIVALPLPVESVQLARLPDSVKRSSTLLPKVVVPLMRHCTGSPCGPSSSVSRIVGPRPLFLTSKSILTVSPAVSTSSRPMFLPPEMTVKRSCWGRVFCASVVCARVVCAGVVCDWDATPSSRAGTQHRSVMIVFIRKLEHDSAKK
jgi:hypothetical protein